MQHARGAEQSWPPIPPHTTAPMIRRYLLPFVYCFAIVAAVMASPARAQDRVHVVALGENLTQIARAYNITLQELIEYNEITDPGVIRVGTEIRIPGGAPAATQYSAPVLSGALPAGNGYYTVRLGDTLESIAERNALSVADIMRLNGLSNSRSVWVGQQLRLSARVDASSVSADQTERSDLAGVIHIVRPGDSLATIAQQYGVTVQGLMAANGLPNPSFVWVGQRLRIKNSAGPVTELEGGQDAVEPADSRKWIDIDLSEQTLTAWLDDEAILQTSISSGLPGSPTMTGRFQVGAKFQSARLLGPGVDLPGVPWVLYYYGSFAIHGAYWHNNFGVPMSQGNINMRVDEAQFLYNWAPSGTEVHIHY